MKNIPNGKQYIDSSDIKSVINSMKQDLITTGKSVQIFEKKISNLFKCKYVSSCSNGTSAIHLALLAIDIKKK